MLTKSVSILLSYSFPFSLCVYKWYDSKAITLSKSHSEIFLVERIFHGNALSFSPRSSSPILGGTFFSKSISNFGAPFKCCHFCQLLHGHKCSFTDPCFPPSISSLYLAPMRVCSCTTLISWVIRVGGPCEVLSSDAFALILVFRTRGLNSISFRVHKRALFSTSMRLLLQGWA